MKLYFFISLILCSWFIQAADTKDHTVLKIQDSIWTLTHKTVHLDGKITETYHLKNGPLQLPLDIQALALLATSPLCCCSRSMKRHVQNFQEQYYDFYEPDTRITKRYVPYQKGCKLS